ncbi:hypothetical protein OAR31_06200 [Candidatus Marinimicrobia bacterium]|nr:hypothetical protein [Candidatus Neomarinimicrobiota bacterium]
MITGIVWAQTDFDKLVLKDGTTYLGEYSKTEEEIVYFKPQNAFAFQPISIKKIKILQLKDGQFIIGSSSDILTYEENQKELIIIEDGKKSLTLEEKAIYDANLYNLNKWALYMPTSTILFVACVVPYWGITDDDEWWENPMFIVPSSSASLIIPYFVLNRKEKFNFPKSILNITDSEKEIYEQAYSKKLRQRKFKYAAVGTIVSVVIVAVAGSSMTLDMSSSSSGGTTGKGFTGFGP